MTATMTPPPATANPRGPSERQIALIRKLLKEREGITGTEAVRDELNSRRESDALTMGVASWAIDTLIAIPAPNASRHPKVVRSTVTEDGMYRDPETDRIFKVQTAKHGSGLPYAKELQTLPVDDGNGPVGYATTFVYEQGLIRTLRPEWKMTLAEAMAYGTLYGNCCVCGATLTDETSIANGIGPVCARRFDR